MRFKFIMLCAVLGFASFSFGADPPRQARSVHLVYTAPEATTFLNQVVVEQSQPNSYFCVCGFSHGYFGIQELREGKKVVIFSVWDPGKQQDAKAVPEDQRVEVLDKADDVRVGRFGNEGTGGQSFFDYPWKVGETYRFAVKATVEGDKTKYAAYFFLNDTNAWKHLVTFRTRSGGDALKGLYSFIEDFRRDVKSAAEVRRARFSDAWVRGSDGEWTPVTQARFSADKTPTDNIDAGVVGEAFYLQTGGDTQNHTPLKSKLTREAGVKPTDELPKD